MTMNKSRFSQRFGRFLLVLAPALRCGTHCIKKFVFGSTVFLFVLNIFLVYLNPNMKLELHANVVAKAKVIEITNGQ